MPKEIQFCTIDSEGNIKVYGSAEQAAAFEDAEHFSTEVELAELARKWSEQRLIEIHNSLPLPNITSIEFFAEVTAAIWNEVAKLPAPKAPGQQSHKEPVMKKKSSGKKEPKAEPKPKAAPAPKKTKAERKAERAAAKAAKKAARAKAKADAKAKKDAAKEALALAKAKKPAKPKKTPKVREPKAPKVPGAPKQPGSSVTPSEKPPKPGSKGEKIINLMCREKGASIEDIAAVLDQKMHTEKTKKDPLATSRGYLSGLRQKFALQFVFTSVKAEGSTVRRYYAKAAK